MHPGTIGTRLKTITSGLVLAIALASCGAQATLLPGNANAQQQTVNAPESTITISGGYELDPRDNGRPVVLIAAALGVSSEVFREAFSKVNPAGAGQTPSDARVHSNKAVLLEALGPYGITNEQLDRVSDYYRYNRSAGEMWPTTPATIEATISNGQVTGVRLIDGGAGYTSLPTITINGHPEVRLNVTLAYGTDLATNGSIVSVSLAD